MTETSPGFIDTSLADAAITDPDIRAAILKQKEALAISPTAIARAIAFAVEQPGEVEIGSIVVRPTAQDWIGSSAFAPCSLIEDVARTSK